MWYFWTDFFQNSIAYIKGTQAGIFTCLSALLCISVAYVCIIILCNVTLRLAISQERCLLEKKIMELILDIILKSTILIWSAFSIKLTVFEKNPKSLKFWPSTPNNFNRTTRIDGDFWSFIYNGKHKVSTNIWLYRNFCYLDTIFMSKLTGLIVVVVFIDQHDTPKRISIGKVSAICWSSNYPFLLLHSERTC